MSFHCGDFLCLFDFFFFTFFRDHSFCAIDIWVIVTTLDSNSDNVTIQRDSNGEIFSLSQDSNRGTVTVLDNNSGIVTVSETVIVEYFHYSKTVIDALLLS